MISYRFVPISSQKGVLFFETPGIPIKLWLSHLFSISRICPNYQMDLLNNYFIYSTVLSSSKMDK